MRALWTPKEGSTETEWEDGFAYDEATGLGAVADGASSAVASGSWARLLATGWVAEPFAVDDRSSFEHWLRRRQPEWSAPEGASGGNEWWNDAVATKGSWATLALVALAETEFGWAVDVGVVGDACVFVVRNGRLVSRCPDLGADDFGIHPELVGTEEQSVTRTVSAYDVARFDAFEGDVVLAVTDALAEWALRYHHTHHDLWDTLAAVDQASLGALVADERAEGRLVNDDVTLLRCQLGGR